ncbi:MAG: hypothetical protein D6731_21560 [Planctomycetota bacterium]|nr:MAG: hypothetical protein D6731_21560 [Planctomycetota bacterium]
MGARACGPCQGCCHVKEIPSLGKPAGRDCRHQGPAGCAVYADRPRGCRRYTCAWIDGWGAEGDRPDLLGVLFEMAPGPFGGLEVRGVELAPGAGDGPAARARLRSWEEVGARVRLQRYPGPAPPRPGESASAGPLTHGRGSGMPANS